ncbi:MAG: YdcF family protein [Deltaproteobacteria bacterium]|nr:YdcF family protein [Deltaproteobacteria bacterium]
MNRRRWLVAALLVAGLCALAARPLARAAGEALVESDPLTPVDAIVVLTGSYPDRILEAAALYREGAAPRLILCREPENAGFRRLAELGVRVPRLYELNRSIAEQLGVPADAISVLDRPAGSTYSEAEVALEYAQARGYRSLLVVTSKYHSARAGRIYRFLAGNQIRILVRPARDDDFQASTWWQDRVSTRRVVIEYQKLLAFLFIDRWRLTPLQAT